VSPNSWLDSESSSTVGHPEKTKTIPARADISAEEIAATLVDLLSSENVRAGMRLRSVRDLAELFRTDYRRAHDAIEDLTERGILAKRHGSGTFVRRMPVAADAGKRNPLFRKLKAQQILSADDGARTRRRPLAKDRHLDFQFWVDTHWHDPVRDSVIQGVTDVLSPLGHRITTCGATNADGQHIEKKELAARLQAHPTDGYLLIDWVAESYGELFTAMNKSWLTYGYSGPIRHQPGMILDCVEAVERGTQALIEGGCRRVALLGWFNAEHEWEGEFERFYYAHALRRAGIKDYHVALSVHFDAGQVRRALAEILDSKRPADGLYLADDNLLPFVAQELERRGLVPGRDLGVVTLWNEDLSGKTLVHERIENGVTMVQHEESPFSSPYDWSRMEQSPRQFGRALARNLIAAAQSANTQLGNNATLATWKPGKTHILPRKA
jgi:DNA-binding transcriptional regulator YhcF (GntR family)